MKKYDQITPEGTRDYLFEQCEIRRNVETGLQQLFISHSFSEVITPTLEFYDVYCNTNIHISQENMYKLIDQKGRLLVLRPDSTAPIARIAATRLKEHLVPLRLFYNQEVYRFSPKLSGRDDIISQMGVELIGAPDREKSDMEMLYTAFQSLEQATGSRSFRIEIGHIGIFQALIQKTGLSPADQEKIRSYIENKNYAALNDVLSKSKQTQQIKALKRLPELFGGIEVFEHAAQLFQDSEISYILDYLRKIYENICRLGYENNVMLDFGIVNEADYYTGIVFNGYIQGAGDVVLSGGRYDNLTEGYGKKMPAIGFGMNINSVVNMLTAAKQYHQNTAHCLIVAMENKTCEAFAVMQKQIEKGVNCEFFCDSDASNACKYAKMKKIPTVVIVGETVETMKIPISSGENEYEAN